MFTMWDHPYSTYALVSNWFNMAIGMLCGPPVPPPSGSNDAEPQFIQM